MKKLKIAVFNTQPPHIYRGGVERRIIEVGKRLMGTVETTVYSGTKSGFRETFKIDGLKVVPCFSTDMFFPLDNWFFNKTVSRMVDKIRADVYEAHTASGYGIATALRNKGKAKPFVHTIHGVLADEYLKSFENGPSTPRVKLAKFFMPYLSRHEKETAENATLVVTISRYSLQKIVQLYNISREKIRIVPNGVDVQQFKPKNISKEEMKQIKSRMELKINEKCILFVGNIIPRKGLHLLIDAMKHICREMKNVKAVIVGSGPLKNSLIKYAKLSNVLEHFIFLGQVEDEMLPKIYNCCDIVVLPSLQEGQGITLLEAQATAKPVVACKVGGVSEIVLHGQTGFLVEPNGLELSEAILKLLTDEDLKKKMGENGRKFVHEKFSWERCAEKMLNVYNEALNIHIHK